MNEKPTLRIRRGEQTYGPMTRDKVNELLAKGRLRETDLVAEEDGPWLPLKVALARKSSDDAPLVDDEPLVSGPVGFDPDYVPLSDPDMASAGAASNSSVPSPKKRESRTLPSAEAAQPSRKPASSGPVKSAPSSGSVKSPSSSGSMKSRPSSGGMKARPSSASIPTPAADETGLDALLQSLAEDERKAPTVAPQRKPPPRRS